MKLIKKYRIVNLFDGGYSVQIKKWYGWCYLPGPPYFGTKVLLTEFLQQTFAPASQQCPPAYASPQQSLVIKGRHDIRESYGKDDPFADPFFKQ